MYARVTQLEIDPVRISIEDALAAYKSEVVPELERQHGYAGSLALVTPEGKGLTVSFWSTRDEADASNENAFYTGVLSKFVTFFRSPPGRERYEVVFSDVPALIES